MRMRLYSLAQVLVAIKLVSCLEENNSDETQEAKNQQHHQQHQGSWAHWWSYDGISGPDYWNINKRWRLCSLGRKQSPVDIRTDRLVYDHLLGPIHLTWSPSTSFSSSSSSSSMVDKHRQQQNKIRVRLLNSGRGIEAWLPEAQSQSQSQSQLILSRGPLSYDYGLFKIELHSAATFNQQQPQQQFSSSTRTTDKDATSRSTNELSRNTHDMSHHNQQEEGKGKEKEEEEEMAPDYLRSGKSSEHLIDGRSFEAELQLHFYNKRLASSASEAQQLVSLDEGRPSLFAAISVFLISSNVSSHKLESNDDHHNDRHHESSSSSSSSSSISTVLDELMLNNLGSLVNRDDSIELLVEREQLERLIPDRHHYITYQGSINRPPCSESVDWIISNRPLRMNLVKFRHLFEKLNTNQENIRPVKPLNRRLLRTTINNLQQQSNNQPSSSASSSYYFHSDANRNQPEVSGRSQGSHHNLNTDINTSNDGTGNDLTSRSSSSSLLTKGTKSSLNCSSSSSSREDPTKQCQEGKEVAKESFNLATTTCSMKPRYVYQLTYNDPQSSSFA